MRAKSFTRRFWRVSLVAGVVIAAPILLGPQIASIFKNINNNL